MSHTGPSVSCSFDGAWRCHDDFFDRHKHKFVYLFYQLIYWTTFHIYFFPSFPFFSNIFLSFLLKQFFHFLCDFPREALISRQGTCRIAHFFPPWGIGVVLTHIHFTVCTSGNAPLSLLKYAAVNDFFFCIALSWLLCACPIWRRNFIIHVSGIIPFMALAAEELASCQWVATLSSSFAWLNASSVEYPSAAIHTYIHTYMQTTSIYDAPFPGGSKRLQ